VIYFLSERQQSKDIILRPRAARRQMEEVERAPTMPATMRIGQHYRQIHGKRRSSASATNFGKRTRVKHIIIDLVGL
jgi:hypothetical protein